MAIIINCENELLKAPLTAEDVEIAVAKYFNPRQNLIVPNVSWGFLKYEADMLVISPCGITTEIEIKVTKADLKADFKKQNFHNDQRIAYLYYAVPEYLASECEILVPASAGIITVNRYKPYFKTDFPVIAHCRRVAKSLCKYRLTKEEQFAIARLGTMRIWSDRKKISKLKNPQFFKEELKWTRSK